MNTRELDIPFDGMRLSGGGDEDEEYIETSSESDGAEGAVGYSPDISQWSYEEPNDSVYHEKENEDSDSEQKVPESSRVGINGRQRYFSNPQPSSHQVLRRHSASDTLVRRQSMPLLASQSMPRIRSENGLQRRGSIQPVETDRQEEVHARRNSIQMDRPVQLSREDMLSSNSLNPNHNHFAYIHASNKMARVGSDLFLTFLREEIEQCNLQTPQCLIPEQDASISSRSLESGEFVQMGLHLRSMADEFARSDQRELVRERAANVILSSLDFNSFSDLLFGMFQQGGVTCERVLVLFIFCTDLAIRALREKLLARFHELTQWSQQYIMSWLSPWVKHHGGWSVVLQHSVNEMYKVAVIGVCFMGMIAFWVYIRNNCR